MLFVIAIGAVSAKAYNSVRVASPDHATTATSPSIRRTSATPATDAPAARTIATPSPPAAATVTVVRTNERYICPTPLQLFVEERRDVMPAPVQDHLDLLRAPEVEGVHGVLHDVTSSFLGGDDEQDRIDGLGNRAHAAAID